MTGWFVHGVMSGIRTTRFPRRRERQPGITPGLPRSTRMGSPSEAEAASARCPTGALLVRGEHVSVDPRKCIHCYRCSREGSPAMSWSEDYEWTLSASKSLSVGKSGAFDAVFRRSVHVLVVDAGDCGACLNEVRQLNNPYYNMHRLGFFITPTPRTADLLLVVGPVTDAMRHPLLAAWKAMPEPRRVAAVGACAVGGSVFGPSFACGAGVRDVLPVDVEVPGNPPPPLAILHALLVLTGRTAARSAADGGMS